MTETIQADPAEDFTRRFSLRHRIRIAGVLAVLLVITATGYVLADPDGGSGTTIQADFGTTVGVYDGGAVKVLGMTVGHVSHIRPEGTHVRVTLVVDKGVAVPADVKAVVVAPSLVSDRYVQLAPAYSGGPVLHGTGRHPATLGQDRTATPLELDQLYDAIRGLAKNLARGGAYNPTGVNGDSPLSDLLNSGAANLGGNGRRLNTAVSEFGKAARTLNGVSGDLFATVGNLSRFTGMLRANDGQIRTAENQLASVTGFLASDRTDLTAALRTLGTALAKLRTFILTHRAKLTTDVDKLAGLTRTLVEQRNALAQALDEAPLVADNALGAYDPSTQSLMARGDLLEIQAAYGSPPQGRGSGGLCGTAAATLPGAQCGATGGSPDLPLPGGTPGGGGTAGGASSGGAR